MRLIRRYLAHAHRHRAIGSHAAAVDPILNPQRLECFFYGVHPENALQLFPTAFQACITVFPQAELPVPYKDGPSADFAKPDSPTNSQTSDFVTIPSPSGPKTPELTPRTPEPTPKTMRKDEAHLAPDFLLYFNALKSMDPKRLKTAKKDYRERARSGLASLDHSLSTGVLLMEIKRDCEPIHVNKGLKLYYSRCMSYFGAAIAQALRQVAFYFAAHPEAEVIPVVVGAGAFMRWALFYRDLTKPASPYKDGTYVPTPEREGEIAMWDVPMETVRQLHRCVS